MTAYTNLGKVSSAKYSSGQKLKLKDRDRRVLKRVVGQNCKITLPRLTSEMNIHLLNPVSMKTVQRELHTANIHGIRKTYCFGEECCKEITVVPRPPKLDATAVGTSHLV
ncbi:HTH_Tnp_Tc3_2 domain-containing protein [Trichonephila clavipes]|nr:HTH_Tnp_Tc3_2 domain-containing protein [Trichonephila clavipes]